MRALILCIAITFSACIQAAEPQTEKPSAVFLDSLFELAFVDVNPQSGITNEYLQDGDTLEEWTAMLSVRQWPEIDLVQDITGPYLNQMQASFVRDAQVFSPPPGTVGTDVVIELYLAPPDKSYLEYNLIRFGKEPGQQGVKMYQFALRGDFDLERAIPFNAQRMGARLEQLGKLRLQAIDSLPSRTLLTRSTANDDSILTNELGEE